MRVLKLAFPRGCRLYETRPRVVALASLRAHALRAGLVLLSVIPRAMVSTAEVEFVNNCLRFVPITLLLYDWTLTLGDEVSSSFGIDGQS